MEMDIRCDGGKKVMARFGGFSVLTDQSREDGGEGSAPAPFDFFLASMGTCAGVYVYAFCESKQIDAENVYLKLRAERSMDDTRLEAVQITIHLPPDFPPRHVKTVRRIAGQFSVKKAILNPPEFRVDCVTDAP